MAPELDTKSLNSKVGSEESPVSTTKSPEERARGYLLTSKPGRQVFILVGQAQERAEDGWVFSEPIQNSMMPRGFMWPQWGALMRVLSTLLKHSLVEHEPGHYRLGEVGRRLWDDAEFRQRLLWRDR